MCVSRKKIGRPDPPSVGTPEPCCQHDEDSGRSSFAADDVQIALVGRGLMNTPG